MTASNRFQSKNPTSLLKLSRQDQIAFAKALLAPAPPNAALLRAMHKHRELLGKTP